MSQADILIKALDNEENEYILQFTSKDIEEKKKNILNEIGVDNEKIDEYLKKLQNYIYVDEFHEMPSGCFIRWIPLKNPDNIFLTKGANICDLNFCNKTSYLKCKNFNNTHMQIKVDECLIFRKMNPQEKLLISAMNYLTK